MGEFFIDKEKVRIDFPDGQWVDVKPELTQEDQDYIVSKMAQAEAVGSKAKVTMTLGKLALLEKSIIAWSFPEPVTRENISRLRMRYRSKVLIEIDRLTDKANEFVSKNA